MGIMLWLGDLSQSLTGLVTNVFLTVPNQKSGQIHHHQEHQKRVRARSQRRARRPRRVNPKRVNPRKANPRKANGSLASGSQVRANPAKASLEKERRKHQNHQREKERQEHGLVLVPDLVHTLDPVPVLEAVNDVQLKRLNLSKNQELRDIEDQALDRDQDHGQEVERNIRKKAKRRVNIQKQNHQKRNDQ